MSLDIISDYSKVDLTEIPQKILDMTNLKMLFLERNLLTKLPDNFFHKLPQLMWLDLRNNFLSGLPKSIGHHEHLEHLLLTNNKIESLPNELGLVPTLKALQIANNPLVYPDKKIVQEGTKAIKNYLARRYEEECVYRSNQQIQKSRDEIRKRLEALERQEERLIKVHEEEWSSGSLDNNNNKSKAAKVPTREGRSSHRTLKPVTPNAATSTRNSSNTSLKLEQALTVEKLQNKFLDPRTVQSIQQSALRVQKLEHPQSRWPPEEPLKIVHNIDKSDSKIKLKSYYNRPIELDVSSNVGKLQESALKEEWMNKLRILLNDQERILQQERNLTSLTCWRQKRPSSPKGFYSSDFSSRRSEIPYATYPEFGKIPSREELTSQLQTFLRASDVRRSTQTSKVNLDKLINDLVEQLKDMEVEYDDGKSPRSEMEKAGQQIQTIVDIHKKLLRLRSVNDCM